ncbi:MAG: TrmH family RNA methyltransferase [Bacteroidales bacterium]|nr:TrmH family RNA methyltransferase [Bacteroidales bacterium]
MQKLSMDELNRLTVDEFRKIEKLPLVVVLDNVRSQNNIGSVFRTSDAFALRGICLCGICSTPPHRDIHKTALGAEDSVEWKYYEETTECVRHLVGEGYRVYAVEQVHDSMMLDSLELELEIMGCESNGVAIVMGNEVEGVQEDVISLCHGSIEIPQYGTKHSLNVSCSAAIVIWHLQELMRNKMSNEKYLK